MRSVIEAAAWYALLLAGGGLVVAGMLLFAGGFSRLAARVSRASRRTHPR